MRKFKSVIIGIKPEINKNHQFVYLNANLVIIFQQSFFPLCYLKRMTGSPYEREHGEAVVIDDTVPSKYQKGYKIESCSRSTMD